MNRSSGEPLVATRMQLREERGPLQGITEFRIFWSIYTNPLISRSEIADTLALEASTITHKVNRLIELGLVSEVAERRASPNGGRRPICLSINGSYGSVVGIECRQKYSCAAIIDFSGNLLFSCRDLPGVESGMSGLKFYADNSSLKKRAGLTGRLLGIGVSESRPSDLTRSALYEGGELDAIPMGETLYINASPAECSAWNDVDNWTYQKAAVYVYLLNQNDGSAAIEFSMVMDGCLRSSSSSIEGAYPCIYKKPQEFINRICSLAELIPFSYLCIEGDVTWLDSVSRRNLHKRLNSSWWGNNESCGIFIGQKASFEIAMGAAKMALIKIVNRTVS